MVPVGVGNEDLGNCARVDVEPFQIMEKNRAARPGVEENPLAIFWFYEAGEAPVSFEAFPQGFVIINNDDLHIEMTLSSVHPGPLIFPSPLAGEGQGEGGIWEEFSDGDYRISLAV